MLRPITKEAERHMRAVDGVYEWLHMATHILIIGMILVSLVFTIVLFGRVRQEVDRVDTELDKLYQVIGVEAPNKSL